MMGFTLVKSAPGYEKSVYYDLQRTTGVRDVYRLFGEFSFFLILQAEERRGLDRALDTIRRMDDVSGMGPLMVTSEGDLLASSLREMGSSAAF